MDRTRWPESIRRSEKTPICRERNLRSGCPEPQRLHSQKGAMQIRPDGILEVRTSSQGKPRWCAICPPVLQTSVMWQTHGLTHSEIVRTLKRLQLTWYWLEMTADTRRLIQTCEVCQMAKHGGTQEPSSLQHLYAGRPAMAEGGHRPGRASTLDSPRQ